MVLKLVTFETTGWSSTTLDTSRHLLLPQTGNTFCYEFPDRCQLFNESQLTAILDQACLPRFESSDMFASSALMNFEPWKDRDAELWSRHLPLYSQNRVKHSYLICAWTAENFAFLSIKSFVSFCWSLFRAFESTLLFAVSHSFNCILLAGSKHYFIGLNSMFQHVSGIRPSRQDRA